MKKINITLIMLVAILSRLNAQQTYVLTPNHDASIGFHDFTNSANTNYGNAIYYGGFSQPGVFGGENAGMGIMSFDLSIVSMGTVISHASLDLFGCGPFGIGDAASVGDIGHDGSYLERITSSWDEYTVTYNTQPSATSKHRVHLLASTSVDEDYLGIDVTQMVQDMINDPNHSFGIRIRLRAQNPTRALAFWSRDGAPSPDKLPTLTITISAMKTLQDGGDNSIAI
ncbi:MAG: DNRLRE domain-containing protein, partial [Chitinophagales bacterium]